MYSTMGHRTVYEPNGTAHLFEIQRATDIKFDPRYRIYLDGEPLTATDNAVTCGEEIEAAITAHGWLRNPVYVTDPDAEPVDFLKRDDVLKLVADMISLTPSRGNQKSGRQLMAVKNALSAVPYVTLRIKRKEGDD